MLYRPDCIAIRGVQAVDYEGRNMRKPHAVVQTLAFRSLEVRVLPAMATKGVSLIRATAMPVRGFPSISR
jgi:hypothetical protein